MKRFLKHSRINMWWVCAAKTRANVLKNFNKRLIKNFDLKDIAAHEIKHINNKLHELRRMAQPLNYDKTFYNRNCLNVFYNIPLIKPTADIS